MKVKDYRNKKLIKETAASSNIPCLENCTAPETPFNQMPPSTIAN
jgi:hypothetical protein